MEQKSEIKEYPFYIKAPCVLLGLVLVVYILSITAGILIPFAIAVLFAILLNPLNNFFQRRFPRIISILFTLLLATIVLVSIVYFLSTRILMFSESLPLLKVKLNILLTQAQNWIQSYLGISLNKQLEILKGSLSGNSSILSNTVGTILGAVSVLVLIPIYVFLLLFYKPLILDFLFQVFLEKHSLRVAEILSQTKSAVQSYMIGLLIETSVVCALNSIALLIIGVPNAIVIGVIGGILNIIPYIGGIVAILLPLLMSTVNSEGISSQIAIIGAYLVIQFIDNNILVPRIVSKKVQINALISILAVLLGGALWGIPGMLLSIPFIAVLKIIFDRIDELKPWGCLLGDEVPTEHIGVEWLKRWNRIFRKKQLLKELEEKEALQQKEEV
jgi:predicted PurR-regulated permease PerM